MQTIISLSLICLCLPDYHSTLLPLLCGEWTKMVSSAIATGVRLPPTDLLASSLLLPPPRPSLHLRPSSLGTSSTRTTSSTPTTSPSRGASHPQPSTTDPVTPSANRRSSASLPPYQRTSGIPTSSSRNLLSITHRQVPSPAISPRFPSLIPRWRLRTRSRCRSGGSNNRRR